MHEKIRKGNSTLNFCLDYYYTIINVLLRRKGSDYVSETEKWNLVIHNADDFWIIKEEGTASQYVVMKKPVGLFGDGQPIKYYQAIYNEQAIEKGLIIAKEHNL